MSPTKYVTLSKVVMDRVYPGWQQVFGDDIPTRQELMDWLVANAPNWTLVDSENVKPTDFDQWMKLQGRGRLDWARVQGRFRVREPELALIWQLSH